MRVLKRAQGRLRTVALFAAVLTAPVAAFPAAAFLGRNRLPSIPEHRRPRVIEDWRAYSEPLNDGVPAEGVRLVVFGDYLCSACVSLWSGLELIRGHRRAAVEWRHFPSGRLNSLPAAIAVECARPAGAAEAMHQLMIAGAVAQPRGLWPGLAHEVGVSDTLAYTDCIKEGNDGREEVEADVAVGRQLGIRATPAVLLDSLLFEVAPSLRYFEVYVRRSIRHE